MPHPDSERSLQIELATVMRQRDSACAERNRLEKAARAYIEGHELALTRAEAAEEALAAARRECDLLRDALTLIAGFPCSGNSYEPVRLARKALSAPAAAAGEEKP